MSNPQEAQTTFSAAHFIYIPLCILVGLVLGWVLGSRSSRDEKLGLQRQLEEHERQAAAQRMAGKGKGQ